MYTANLPPSMMGKKPIIYAGQLRGGTSHKSQYDLWFLANLNAGLAHVKLTSFFAEKSLHSLLTLKR